MKGFLLSRGAASSAMAALLLASCGGGQPRVGPSGTTTPNHASNTHVVETDPPQRLAAKRRSLLYVTSGVEAVFVYTFPRLKYLGELGTFQGAGIECADKYGDVFIGTGGGLLEYPHGGAEPIHTLNLGGPCSRDAITGDLAAVRGSQLLIYRYSPKRGWLFPHTHSLSFTGLFGGYDNAGNLFIDGHNATGQFQFAELKKHDGGVTNITVNQTIESPGQVQWDGTHIAVGDSGIAPNVIYQLSINGSTGEVVGSTTLSGSKDIGEFWINGGYVAGPDSSNGNVGLWRYPQGGSRVRFVSAGSAYAAAVSVAPK